LLRVWKAKPCSHLQAFIAEAKERKKRNPARASNQRTAAHMFSLFARKYAQAFGVTPRVTTDHFRKFKLIKARKGSKYVETKLQEFFNLRKVERSASFQHFLQYLAE